MKRQFRRNSACIKPKLVEQALTVSMTIPAVQYAVDNMPGDSLYHSNPEDYFLWIEEMQANSPLELDLYWDE